jgi:hypothetical protein
MHFLESVKSKAAARNLMLASKILMVESDLGKLLFGLCITASFRAMMKILMTMLKTDPEDVIPRSQNLAHIVA